MPHEAWSARSVDRAADSPRYWRSSETILGRDFLISSVTLAGVSSKSPHLMSRRFGLVDLLLGHVVVAQVKLLPRFVQQPPTPLLGVDSRRELIGDNGGGRRPRPAGRTRRRQSAVGLGGYRRCGRRPRNPRPGLPSPWPALSDRHRAWPARRVGADRDRCQRPASTWRPDPTVHCPPRC